MSAIHLPTAEKRSWALGLIKMPDSALAAQEQFGRPDPRDFVRDVLGLKPTAAATKHGYKDPWTPDQEKILVSLMKNRRTAVPSGHSNGKTYIAGVGALWFLYSFPHSKVITTAPTHRQVKNLWAEIRAIWARSAKRLPGHPLLTELELGPDWYALGFATKPDTTDLVASRFQGYHAPGGVLFIGDEATGLEDEILGGGESITTAPNCRQLLIGNPTDPSCGFKTVCDSAKWTHIQMDCRNHPNVIHDEPSIVPGAVTKEWVEDQADIYGEDSALYKAKVLGLWPEQSEDALIRFEWIAKAQARFTKLIDDEKRKPDGRGAALGLDIAGEGSDLTVLSKVEDAMIEIPLVAGKRAWHVGRDITHATDLVIAAIEEYPTVRSLTLDDSGLGAGVSADLMKRQRDGKLPKFLINPDPRAPGALRSLRIERVNFGARAWAHEQFDLAKDELWWTMREALRKGPLTLPTEDVISGWRLPKDCDPIDQLTRPIYAAPRGRIMVYDKRSSAARIDSPDLKQRIQTLPTKSPDVAHSFLLAVAGWLQLKPQQTYKPPTTAEEMFQQRTRELAQRGRRGFKDPKKARTPWQRMR